MSLYTDIFDGVVVWTNRPLMTAAIDVAIRQAVRSAHKAGSFYRDLVSVDAPVAQATIQQIDLSVVAPNYRQLYTITPTGSDTIKLDEEQANNLFDQDGFRKTNIVYGFGNYLMIRAADPAASYTITYLKYPTTSPIASLDSWIADKHQDLIILWAAATILTMTGEQEIKTRVEGLAQLAHSGLISDELSILGN